MLYFDTPDVPALGLKDQSHIWTFNITIIIRLYYNMDTVGANVNDRHRERYIICICAELNTFLTFGVDCTMYIFCCTIRSTVGIQYTNKVWSVYCDNFECLFPPPQKIWMWFYQWTLYCSMTFVDFALCVSWDLCLKCICNEQWFDSITF